MFGIGLAGLLLASSALLVEVVLRVYAGMANTALAQALRSDPYEVLIEPHGHLGFRPRPERTFRYANGTSATTNRMAFRGPEVAVPKPDGTVRALLLGGSSTFGWGVNDTETIDRHMSRILTERYPNLRVEVVNLAFDGYDSYQLLERLRSDGLRLQPDAVIVNAGVNDAHNAWVRNLEDGDRRTLLYEATMEQLRVEAARGGPTLWTRTKHYLYLGRLPGWVRGQAQLAAARAATDGKPPPYYWDALDYFERNLRRIVDLVADSSGAVLFSTPPSSLLSLYEPDEPPRASYWIHDARTTQLYRDSLSSRMQAVAANEAAGGREVTYIPHGEFAVALFMDDVHLTSEGNRRMAEDFVSALEPWLAAR
jgi:lysophospholipase L1-like esterase